MKLASAILARIRSFAAAAGAPLTLAGRVVALIGVFSWLVGAWFGWKEFAIVAGVCVVALALGCLALIGSTRLETELEVSPPRVVVGERAGGSLVVVNAARRRSRALRVELPVGRGIARFDFPALGVGDSHDELFVVPTHRRAIIPVGPVTTVRGDALGLVRRTHEWSDRKEIVVHPRTVRLEALTAGLIRDLEGHTTNHLSNADIAFHTLRDYVPGDDRRHVHWKTSAKLGALMVRQYVDTRRSHICVALPLDPACYVDDEEFELSVSAVASVAVQALRDEQTVTVVVGGRVRDAAAPTDLLDLLSAVTIEPDQSLDQTFAAVRRHASEASITVVTTGTGVATSDVRRSATRLSADTRLVVLRCRPDAPETYRFIGTSYVIELGSLAGLRRGLSTVA